MKDVFQEMVERWPSALVARRKVGDFTGGAISPKYLANLDCLNLGPSEKVVVAGHVCYPTQPFSDWLRARSK